MGSYSGQEGKLTSATGSGPLRIRVGTERHADRLSEELADIGTVEVHRSGATWVVSLDCAKTGPIVTRVLERVRSTLAGQPAASAQVLLDGHRYHMSGE